MRMMGGEEMKKVTGRRGVRGMRASWHLGVRGFPQLAASADPPLSLAFIGSKS